MSDSIKATSIGSLSILFWSLTAILTTNLKNIPTYEIISIIFGTSFLVIAAKLTMRRNWHTVAASPGITLVGTLLLFGVQYFYNQAFKYAPPLEADLINYLWPVYMLMMTAFIPKESLTRNQFVGACIAFLGIYFLMYCSNHRSAGFNRPWIGYAFAFIDGLCWASYTLLTRHYQRATPDMIGIYSGLAAAIAMVFHFKYESFVMPTHSQVASLLTIGVMVVASGNWLWNYGVKHGNYKLMGILSYLTPVISILWLAFFCQAKLSYTVLIACGYIAFGAFIAERREPLRFNFKNS